MTTFNLIVGTPFDEREYFGPGGFNPFGLEGTAGNDIIFALGGDDHLFGNDGDDILFGGAGNDIVWGVLGDDTLFGGDGSDTFSFTIDPAGSGLDVVMDFEAGVDQWTVGVGPLRSDDFAGITEITNLSFQQVGDDVLVTFAPDDVDVAIFKNVSVADLIAGYFRADTPDGTGFPNVELFFGAPGADNALVGTDGQDVLVGADPIDGVGGNDSLVGRDGYDVIYGLDGNDTIVGGADTDNLYGGAGEDLFVFETGPKFDFVFDFVAGEDSFTLGDPAITFDDLAVNQVGDDTVVRVGLDVVAVLRDVDASTIDAGDFIA